MKLIRPPTVFIIADFISYTPANKRDKKMRYQINYKQNRVDVFVKFFASVQKNIESFPTNQNNKYRSHHVENIGIKHRNTCPTESDTAYFASLDGHNTQNLKSYALQFWLPIIICYLTLKSTRRSLWSLKNWSCLSITWPSDELSCVLFMISCALALPRIHFEIWLMWSSLP